MPRLPQPVPAPFVPLTAVLQDALPRIRDHSAREDLLFLERWEMMPQPGMGAVLRVQQIRRANPVLADAIRAEVAGLLVR
jgi:hypothetical protein